MGYITVAFLAKIGYTYIRKEYDIQEVLHMKKSWVAAITALSLTLAVGGAAYYINSVYLPAKQLEAANALRTDAPAHTEEGTNYDYTIKVGETVTPNTEKFSEGSSVTVTADETTGDVWITRDWLNDGSSRVSSEPPTLEDTGRVEANIGSGGANIVGSDGVYHGEQPTTPPPATTKPTTTTPTAGTSAGATETQPVQQQDNETPAPSTSDPVPVPADEKPATPPPETAKTPNEQTEQTKPAEQAKPSGSGDGNTSGKETGKNGQTRVVDGQEQMWVNGWGWVPVTHGSGQSERFEMETTGEHIGDF